MQFKANDGSMHPSQMKAYQASQSKPGAGLGSDTDAGSAKSIQDDPKAMQLVDQLQNMGYTAEDVERAMQGGEPGQMDKGTEATQAAPLQIPGA